MIYSADGRLSTADNQPMSFDTNGQSVQLSGALVGTGSSLAKSGDGTLVVTGNNTYTGNTTVSGGTVQFSGGSLAGGKQPLRGKRRRLPPPRCSWTARSAP